MSAITPIPRSDRESHRVSAWRKARFKLCRLSELARDTGLAWSQRASKADPKCALIEYTGSHLTFLPSMVYMLNRLGIWVDVYWPRLARNENPFLCTDGLKYVRRDSDGLYLAREMRQRFRHYDLVVVNSLEPKWVLQQASDIPVPMLGVVHNPESLLQDPDYRSFFDAPNRHPLVLAKHASDFLSGVMAATWIAPVYYGDHGCVRPGSDSILFSVQGDITASRRNYDSLLEAVEELAARGLTNCRFSIVGDSDTRDGVPFKRRVHERGLDSFFEFRTGHLSFQDFLSSLLASHFTLPLVDRTRDSYNGYFESKITSSIPLAIGLGLVPVMHAELARVYGIQDCAITHQDGGLAEGIRRSLEISAEEAKALQSRLHERREELLAQSTLNVKSPLDSALTFPAPSRGRQKCMA